MLLLLQVVLVFVSEEWFIKVIVPNKIFSNHNNRMTTVIIGNGILALTTALRLAITAGATDKIIIVGKKERPGSATLAAAAMLNSFCELDETSLDTDIDIFRFDLSYRATRMWPKFVLDHMDIAMKRNCLIGECATCQGDKGACFELGTYLISNPSADSLDDTNYNVVLKALKDFMEPHFEIDPRDIPNYKPQQRHRALRAVYIPNEGWLNPKLTIRSIEASVECFDCVELVDATVETIVKDGAEIGHVVLHDGTCISGDKFIVANGAGAGELISRSHLGITIPGIFCSVGVSIQISAPDSPHTKAIRTPNRGLACGLYTVPFYTGPDRPLSDIIIGSSSFVSPTPHFEPRVGPIQSLLTGAMEQINSDFYRANVKCVNTGLRPLSADTYPVVGRSSINNLIIATATKRDGFHLAPVISETLAKLVHDEPIDAEWAHFAPERKLIRNLSREKAIDLGVRHMMSGSYQHGFVPSHDRLADRMKNMLKYELETLHDTVGAHEWGIPPELLDMYRYGHISAND